MKTRIQEFQDKQQLAFAVCMLGLFFAVTAGGCACVAWKAGNLWHAVPLIAIALLLLVWPVRPAGKRFLRLGAEVERLQWQRW